MALGILMIVAGVSAMFFNDQVCPGCGRADFGKQLGHRYCRWCGRVVGKA